jgi:O-acetyl-ADP-ribose deacetylase (regulator of RNase III)
MAKSEKTCFVIMPFGEKPDVDGKLLDFDKIYKFIIKEAIESLGIECIRCDEIGEAGWIHADMMEHILEDDVAVVDVTTLNANVFYELGVRHALRESVTVLIRREGTRIPFNLRGFRVIDYNPEDLESVDKAKKEIADFVQNGLKLKCKDSLVYEVLDTLTVGTGSKTLDKCEVFEYQLREVPGKKICLITGDIQNVRIADVWVNSENTNMQMARYYDRSISSVIRYLGAKRDQVGHVVDDTIANELVEIMGDHKTVPPATVVVTGSGELARTHKVKKVFHVASVQGAVAHGYSPIGNIEACVTSVLRRVDSPEFRDAGFKSILFPLMGTGTGRGSLRENAGKLIEAAIAYLEANPDSVVEKVYFLNWRDKELEVCQGILQRADEVTLSTE